MTGAGGDRLALLAGAAVHLVATLPPFVFPAWRQMDRSPTQPEDRSKLAHRPTVGT